MSERFRKTVDDLNSLTLLIRHCCDQVEAKVSQVNPLLEQLGRAGILREALFVGPIIHQRDYLPIPGGRDSGQIVQAAMHVPLGLGVVLWDSEQFAALGEIHDGPESEASAHFVPFEKCEPVLKALLKPHVEDLLEQLRQRISNS